MIRLLAYFEIARRAAVCLLLGHRDKRIEPEPPKLDGTPDQNIVALMHYVFGPTILQCQRCGRCVS
jgi:hypothetical protein